MKRDKRKLERKWRMSKLEIDHQLYREHCKQTNTLLRQAHLDYYSQKVLECGRDQKEVFKITKHLMGGQNTTIYPQHDSAQDLAEKFNSFFCNKIKVIRDNLGNDLPSSHPPAIPVNPPIRPRIE